MSKRAQNEKKFGAWETLSDGGRRYALEIAGRFGWKARYLKEVDANEVTQRFRSEEHTSELQSPC